MAQFLHPVSRKIIEGERLKSGERIEAEDRFDSCDGNWRSAKEVGEVGQRIKPQSPVIWVRREGRA